MDTEKVQLLHKLSIRAVDGPEKLIKIIKNPIADHLPPNCRKISKTWTIFCMSVSCLTVLLQSVFW